MYRYYRYPVGARGGPNFDTFSAGREPRNFWKNVSYRRKKQMKSCEGARDDSCEGAPKRAQLRRAPSQPSKFPGSVAAHETFLPAELAFWGSFSKHLRKASREKRGLCPGSFAVLRVPQKEANFAKIACFEPQFRRKNAIQECAKKVGHFTPPIPQKERFFFSRSDDQKSSVPQKERIFGKISKVSHMVKSRKPWKN